MYATIALNFLEPDLKASVQDCMICEKAGNKAQTSWCLLDCFEDTSTS